MYHPPLHRKLLPWLYGAIFLVVAPALIFYTAGYRYNIKKATIEKYGTLIVDSTPSGATVFVDGEEQDTTPSALQAMAPGWHRVRFEKTNYLPWEKYLEIRPERVTFADQVHLWQTNPVTHFLFAGSIQSMASNPEQDTLAATYTASDASPHLLLVQSKGRISLDTALPTSDANKHTIQWQADSRALSLESNTDKTTLIRFVGKGISTTSTSSEGFWMDNDFISFANGAASRWNSRNGTFANEEMTSSVREKVGDFSLQKASTSTQLLFDRTFSSRAFSLPAGQWNLENISSNSLLLRDGIRWLGVNPRQEQPFLGLVEGDIPRWHLTTDDQMEALFLHNNELWLWNIGNPPELLVRDSEPIREAVWHASGDAVFLATANHVDVLDLDNRGGRIRHTLATFDQIQDIDIIGKLLYVAGTKDGQTGLWSVTVE